MTPHERFLAEVDAAAAASRAARAGGPLLAHRAPVRPAQQAAQARALSSLLLALGLPTLLLAPGLIVLALILPAPWSLIPFSLAAAGAVLGVRALFS